MPVTLQVHINGDDKTALMTDRLLSVTLTDNAGIDADSLHLTLDDRAPHIKLPPIEAALKLWLNQVYMGYYHVTELETDDKAGTLAITATGARFTGPIKAPREASYDNLTLGELAAGIAQRHGHPLNINEGLAATALGHIDQRAESDLALLTRLTRPLDAIAKLNDNRLIIVPKDAATSASGQTQPALTLDARTEGVFIQGTIKGRARVSQVKAHWQSAEMPHKQAVIAGETGQTYTLRETYSTEAQAEAAAKAKRAELQRAEVAITITLPGNPHHKAERALTLTRHRHAGDYIIQSATHRISPGQVYTTAITATTKRNRP